MVRLGVLRWSVAILALFGTRPLLANPITFTGNVEADFPTANQSVKVFNVDAKPTDVGPSTFMNQNGWYSGWALKDVRLSYDPRTDTLAVGFNTFTDPSGRKAIIGDADGNGDPGGASPQMQAAHGVDYPSLGGHESIALAFAPDNKLTNKLPGTPLIVAGVPADKAAAGPGLIGFNVAQYKNVNLGLGYNFGQTVPDLMGNLAFDPSAAHPGFEFTIKNFKKFSGLDPSKGFWIKAYAGSPDDVVVGESSLSFVRVPAFAEENIPEPATALGWVLTLGAAALYRRRRRAG